MNEGAPKLFIRLVFSNVITVINFTHKLGELAYAIKTRHDIVHINGTDKDGFVFSIELE